MLTTRDFTFCWLTALTSPSHLLPRHFRISTAGHCRRRFSCSLRVEELSTSNDHFKASPGRLRIGEVLQLSGENEEKRDEEEKEEEKGISKIRVSRQKYVPVSKVELLDAIVAKLFHSQDEDASQFCRLSSAEIFLLSAFSFHQLEVSQSTITFKFQLINKVNSRLQCTHYPEIRKDNLRSRL